MRLSFSSGSIFNGLAVIGAGMAVMVPDQKWIGAVIVAAGALSLVFDIKVDRGHLEVGSPHSFRTRVRAMLPQTLMILGAIAFFAGLALYLQTSWLRERSEKEIASGRQAEADEAARLKAHPADIRKPDPFERKEQSTRATPPTLFDWFMHDFGGEQGVSWSAYTDFKIMNPNDPSKFGFVRVPYRIIDSFNSNAKFLSVYVPAIAREGKPAPDAVVSILEDVARNYPKYIADIQAKRTVQLVTPGGAGNGSTDATKFSGRIYIYYCNVLTYEQLGDLSKEFSAHGADVVFRDLGYAGDNWIAIQDGKLKAPPHVEPDLKNLGAGIK